MFTLFKRKKYLDLNEETQKEVLVNALNAVTKHLEFVSPLHAKEVRLFFETENPQINRNKNISHDKFEHFNNTMRKVFTSSIFAKQIVYLHDL